MKTLRFLLFVAAAAAGIFSSHLPAFAGGDEIEMKDGSILQGNIIAQNAQQIYLDTKEKGLMKIDVSDIRTLRFGPVAARNLPEIPPPSPSSGSL